MPLVPVSSPHRAPEPPRLQPHSCPAREIDILYFHALHLGSGQHGVVEDGTLDPAAPHIGMGKDSPGAIGVPEVAGPHIGMLKIDPRQINAPRMFAPRRLA